MGCFYCDAHHEGREAIMYYVGEMKAGTLYLFKDQAHLGRCVLALKDHKTELCECDPQELMDYLYDDLYDDDVIPIRDNAEVFYEQRVQMLQVLELITNDPAAGIDALLNG